MLTREPDGKLVNNIEMFRMTILSIQQVEAKNVNNDRTDMTHRLVLCSALRL
jgi:hypothetical protein